MSDRFPLCRGPLLGSLFGALLLCSLGLTGCTAADLPDALPGSEGSEKRKDEAARAEFYETSALTYYDGGKYEAAAQMWEKVLAQKPDYPKAKWGLAKALQMIGTPQSLRRAEEILKPILDLDWSHPEIGDRRHEVKGTLAMVYQDLADLYDRDVRVLQERIRAVEEQRERAPEGGLAETYAQLQKQIAMRNDLLTKAIPLWETSLAVRDDHPYALAGLGKAHLMLGHDEKGIEYSRRYILVARSGQAGRRKLIKEWEQFQGGRGLTPEQREHFARQIQEAKDNELRMHLLLGSVHMRREEYALALDEYNAVLEIDPATPAALVERAQAQAKLGRFPLAVQDLEDYLKITDPEKHRTPRSRAADLLDKYRKMAGQEGIYKQPPAGAPTGLPATPR